MRRTRYAAAAALLTLVLTACTSDDTDADADPDTDPTTSGAPQALQWQDTGESPEQTVVVGREWRAVVSPDATSVTVRRNDADGAGEDQYSLDAGRERRFDQVLMSGAYAVLVSQDQRERQPAAAKAVDLADGTPLDVTGPSPAPGGTWALHGDELRYPTFREDRYCVAAVHLPSGESQVDWCAEPRQGWSRVTQSRWGTALMTFDDTRPISCRTLAVLTDGTPTPVAGVPECAGWEAVATESGAVWTALTDERNVSEGRAAATVGNEVVDLGTAATGTLTPCGEAVFLARPATDEGPSALVRVLPDGEADTVWEAPGSGPGLLAAPACADDVLTLTYLGEDGDLQLWAPVA